jgi:hypothetical protein
MSVDMSATAVTQRLKILGELWELGVSLMRAQHAESDTAKLSEKSLAEPWNTSEEDRAWQHLADLPQK